MGASDLQVRIYIYIYIYTQTNVTPMPKVQNVLNLLSRTEMLEYLETIKHLKWASLVVQMVKNLPAMRKTRSIPVLGRSIGEGNGNPLQYSCLENTMDRETWQTTVHGVTESDRTEQLTLSFFLSMLSKLPYKSIFKNYF